MRSTLDKSTRAELINRIDSLNENNTAQWGTMTVYQMIKHCALWEEMVSGKIKCKQAFIGRLFGKVALKSILRDEKPLTRSTPTSPELRVKEKNGDVASEKNKWITLMEENSHSSNPGFVHPFFGKLTKEQIGYLAYKHTDHHLRQFDA